jgi:cation:H+ antiporter
MQSQILLESLLALLGLGLLYLGGEFLVRGGAAIARRLRLAPIVIGLTVVAFGTSAPELIVSLISAVQDHMAVSVGNVVGSNVVNIALILGLAALISPITVSRRVSLGDTPIMLGTYVVLALVTLNYGAVPIWIGGSIFRLEGVIMVLLLLGYIVFTYRTIRGKDVHAVDEVDVQRVEDASVDSLHTSILVAMVIAGVAALGFGGQFLVRGATFLAANVFGASDRFIGITMVALGTSLPELMTSIIALARRQSDISLGNIIGSNIFNSLFVLGVTAVVRPISLSDSDFAIDFGVMVTISLVLFVIVGSQRKLPRWSGALLLAFYIGYFAYLLTTRTV